MEALIKVQQALKAPKTQLNQYGGFVYRSCEDILEAVKPLLAENNLQLTLTDEPVAIADRIYIRATARVTDGEQTVEVAAYARESLAKKGMDESQVTGAASSYARKYALNGLFLIDDTRDADVPQEQAQPTPPPQKDKTELRQRMIEKANTLKAQAISQGVKEEGIKSWCEASLGTSDPNQMLDKQIEEYGKYLATMVEDTKDRLVS